MHARNKMAGRLGCRWLEVNQNKAAVVAFGRGGSCRVPWGAAILFPSTNLLSLAESRRPIAPTPYEATGQIIPERELGCNARSCRTARRAFVSGVVSSLR